MLLHIWGCIFKDPSQMWGHEIWVANKKPLVQEMMSGFEKWFLTRSSCNECMRMIIPPTPPPTLKRFMCGSPGWVRRRWRVGRLAGKYSVCRVRRGAALAPWNEITQRHTSRLGVPCERPRDTFSRVALRGWVRRRW